MSVAAVTVLFSINAQGSQVEDDAVQVQDKIFNRSSQKPGAEKYPPSD